MIDIVAETKAKTEALMWEYLDAHKAKDEAEQKRLYGEIMVLCGILQAAGEDVEVIR